MQENITYNQIIGFEKNVPIKCYHIKRSFIDEGQLILILDDIKKISISGKIIDVSEHKNRICEMVEMAEEKGFDIPEKSIKHYAKGRDDEYVLIRW